MTAKYTLKNLTESRTRRRVRVRRASRRPLRDRGPGRRRTGVSHHRVKPGKRQGFAHKHDEAEEVYVVIAELAAG